MKLSRTHVKPASWTLSSASPGQHWLIPISTFLRSLFTKRLLISVAASGGAGAVVPTINNNNKAIILTSWHVFLDEIVLSFCEKKTTETTNFVSLWVFSGSSVTISKPPWGEIRFEPTRSWSSHSSFPVLLLKTLTFYPDIFLPMKLLKWKEIIVHDKQDWNTGKHRCKGSGSETNKEKDSSSFFSQFQASRISKSSKLKSWWSAHYIAASYVKWLPKLLPSIHLWLLYALWNR